MIDSTTPEAVALPATASRQPEPERQPLLPLKLDAKRPSDRIRARIYHDGRITGTAFAVLMVLSEHVREDDQTYSCYPSRASLMRWVHCGDTALSSALRLSQAWGVLRVQHRRRETSRYIFVLEWIAKWEPESQRGKALGSLDAGMRHPRGEPTKIEDRSSSITGTGPTAGNGRPAVPAEVRPMTDDDGHDIAAGTASAGQVRYARTHGLPLARDSSSSDANAAIRAHKQSAKGSANIPKRRPERTAASSPWESNTPSQVLLIQNALQHGKRQFYTDVLSKAASFEYAHGQLFVSFTDPDLARQAKQQSSWIAGVVEETVGRKPIVVSEVA